MWHKNAASSFQLQGNTMILNLHQAAIHLGPMFEKIAGDGQLVLDQLDLPASATVLDVGTGAGNFAIFLAMQGLRVITGEPESDTTHYAGKDWAANAAAVGVEDLITFQPFNASGMPFASGAFDAVFFFGVLHHVEESERSAVFREALRVVKPGGSVVYFEPSRETLEQVWVNDPGHPLAANPSDYRPDHPIEEQKIRGKMTDIYIYRSANVATSA
jgi:2-polyprenyl-3-methyl-5-hydroxy-6-metoxy-1,4-benzoquinol methylase